MPDQKISAFTALTTPASADEIPIVDVDVVETKKITVSNLIYTWITDVAAGGNNLTGIQNLQHDISASGTDIDFNEDEIQTISISSNTTFTTANRTAGRSKVLKIITDGTLRTLTFPGWDWTSSIPADQAANKNGYLTLTCFGTTDASIVAAYQVGSL